MRIGVFRLAVLPLAVFTVALCAPAAAQDRRDEQFYYPGSFNWQFLKRYPEAARLFNAFDYGHAVLYEVLYTKEGDREARALEKEYRYLTTDLLMRPPRFAIAEEAVMPHYARLAWRGKMMFDWAHVLHRQIYDLYADERIPMAAKDSLIERITDYYLSKYEYAFLPAPKSMALMDEQHFSQVFRRRYPKFNGLIWAYHWLQVGLYEPLIVGQTPDERKAGIQAALARFFSMMEDPPERFPQVMPMTSAVAPEFSRRHPRAAAIFDNLHMAHDIISDVLASERIPPGRKRDEIYAQLGELRDSTGNLMTWEEWGMMAEHMGGVERMGGRSTDILEDAPSPAPPSAPSGHGEHGGHGGRPGPPPPAAAPGDSTPGRPRS